MNRLFEIQEILDEMISTNDNNLMQISEWNDIADDIIEKLQMIKTQCPHSQPPLSPRSIFPSPYFSPRLHSLMFTPPASSASSEHSDSSVFSDCSYTSACQAFDRQIYSRCIQIVENALKQGPIDLSMISLAHHSYKFMVHYADENDAKKFANWWNIFLDSVGLNRPDVEKIEILDYQAVALEILLNLDEEKLKQTSTKILWTMVESYKTTSKVYRTFHSRTLRRLEKLVKWIDQFRDNNDGIFEHQELRRLLEESIRSTLIDRQRYETETDSWKNRSVDLEYSICNDILKDLSERLAYNVKLDQKCEQTDLMLNLITYQSLDLKQSLFSYKESHISSTHSSAEDIVIRL